MKQQKEKVGVTILASGISTMLPLLPNQCSAFATFPGEDSTKIAFTSNRDCNWEIYVMNAQDGSNQTRLTDNADDFAYSLSEASFSSSQLLQIRLQAPHSIVVMMMIIIRHRSLNYYYYYCPPCFSLSS